MSRTVTAVVLLAGAMLAIFRLSGWPFIAFVVAVVELAALEYVRIASRLTTGRIMWSVPLLVPVAVMLLLPDVVSGVSAGDRLLLLGFLLAGVVSLIALFSRSTLEQTVEATGLTSYGVLYFAVPIAALVRLQATDPWLVILVLAIVAAGDTAAFYIGTAFGRHKLAPVVSPNKSWEGAIAGVVAAVAAAAAWSGLRTGEVEPWLLVVVVGTSAAAQAGDLVESTLKRRAGVKDSGRLLPGHGGMLDRLDSLLFAAPVLALGLVLIGWELT